MALFAGAVDPGDGVPGDHRRGGRPVTSSLRATRRSDPSGSGPAQPARSIPRRLRTRMTALSVAAAGTGGQALGGG